MGMFDTDREIGNRIDSEFDLREDFILYGVEVDPTLVPTEMGDATKTKLEVARMDTPDQRFEVATLASAIADKAKQAMPEDFPCVVQLRKVKGRFDKQGEQNTLVLQWIKDYKG